MCPDTQPSMDSKQAALEVLDEIEWNCLDLGTGDCEGCCPWCQCRRKDGHAPDCRLALVLDALVTEKTRHTDAAPTVAGEADRE